ncbi:MAG: hypothetical protein HRU19_25640 [Pseudobacteriovorax sp.]|nr:hypothetical protein [Pseudobacteriovorax sp.]
MGMTLLRDALSSDVEAIIWFDQSCKLCRELSRLVKPYLPESWQLQAWQEYAKQNGLPQSTHKLKVRVGTEILIDRDAWDFVLMNIPAIESYMRVASRLGLQQSTVSLVRLTGRFMRRFCRGCR